MTKKSKMIEPEPEPEPEQVTTRTARASSRLKIQPLHGWVGWDAHGKKIKISKPKDC